MSEAGRPELDWQALRDRLAAIDAAVAEARTPDEARRRAILAERARRLARPVAEAAAPVGEEHLLFALRGERMALSASVVVAVARATPVTALPGGPRHLCGVANLRGEVLAVFDLALLLGLPPRTAGEAAPDTSPLLVLGADGRGELGLPVDDVLGLVALDPGALQPVPEGAPTRHLLCGTTVDGCSVLDGPALLADPRLVVYEGEGAGAAGATRG